MVQTCRDVSTGKGRKLGVYCVLLGGGRGFEMLQIEAEWLVYRLQTWFHVFDAQLDHVP